LSKKLVIVESPAKAKTIGKYLGKEYLVKASMGHVKDLPKNEMGVEIENGFLPHYEVIPGKEKVLNEIKEAAGRSSSVFLATDPDREGEAISYHLKEEVEPVNNQIYRVMFHEITAGAIRDAFSHPSNLDMNRVKAQWARRVLDRLVGYLISPLLWKKLKGRLSAGRVQSVALRMICEREEKRESFVREEYWVIEARLKKDREFTAKLTGKGGKKYRITSEEEARRAVHAIKNHQLKVEKVEAKEREKKAPPPLITSTLQQEAFKLYRFPVKKTMQIAQRLYEGVDLGDGPVGLITYMRTDSFRVSPEALRAVRKFIGENYGGDYLPPKANQFRAKKGAQEAHEAIRPTYVEITPESLRGRLKPEELKIYTLVWKRFVASQMKPYRFRETKVEIKAGEYTLEAEGRQVLFPGYRKLLEPSFREEGLPPLEPGDLLQLLEVKSQRKETQPPPRFTEATLVKELEEKGIGRPSTYATIISTIQDRTYVRKEDGKFVPTFLGRLVVRLLKESFPDIMDYRYTAEVEEELDRVEKGEREWSQVVGRFYATLEDNLKRAQEKMPSVTLGIPTGLRCPACGGELLLKRSRFGLYFQCERCQYKSQFSDLITKAISLRCPRCGSPLTVKRSRRGEEFIACSNYPSCNYIYNETEDLPCPEEGCGGHLVKRKGKGGKYFYGCSNYPECDFLTPYPPVRQACPECGFPYMLKKGRKLLCPKCGAEVRSHGS